MLADNDISHHTTFVCANEKNKLQCTVIAVRYSIYLNIKYKVCIHEWEIIAESRLDNGVISINLSRTFFTGIGHVLEYIDQVLKQRLMQKLKRHGNGGSCFKKHEKLKIKIFAERVMENHIYTALTPFRWSNVFPVNFDTDLLCTKEIKTSRENTCI